MCFYVFLVNAPLYAQKVDSLRVLAFTERIRPAPATVFTKFRDAGMNPTVHVLTAIEKKKVDRAFSILPSLHQKILKEHLHSISFMDNMPNTAFTSPVEPAGPKKMFNITFRAGILNETISEWATWKENTYYTTSEKNAFQVIIEGGDLDAITYILLHEATHIVDAVLNITPQPDENDDLAAPNPFITGVWHNRNEPLEKFIDPILETTRFRSGKPMAISSAANVYKALLDTPFASLYSMASWHEDLAELLTIYHLTGKMDQPYKILVRKNGEVVFAYEPFSNGQVVKRRSELMIFYAP